MHYTSMVCHALDVKGLLCITRQGFAMHYTARVCHALHVKGLPCITRQGFAMHYTARVCHALHGKALPCITRQGFAMHCTARVCRTLLTKKLHYGTDNALNVAWVCCETYRSILPSWWWARENLPLMNPLRTAVQFVLAFDGSRGLEGFSVRMLKPCFSECRHAGESEKQKDEGTHAWHD